jgi:cobalt-zinc-cadmium efflux system outer membrane protein
VFLRQEAPVPIGNAVLSAPASAGATFNPRAPGRSPARRQLAPLAGLAALAFALPGLALSPEQAVERALARPEIELGLRAGIDLARADLAQARTWANPELRLEHEDPDAPADGADETSVLLAQEFLLGGRRGLQRIAAESGIVAARAGAASARAALRAEVLAQYYTVLAGDRSAAEIGAHADRLSGLARAAERRRAAGDLSGYESRRIAQLLQAAQARLAIARGESELARGLLSGLIAGPVPDLDADQALAPPPPPPLAALVPDLDAAVDLQALDRQRDAAAANLRAAARPALPVTIGVGQKRIGSGGGDALLLEVSLPLPLFDRNQAATARAAAQAADAEARHAQARVAAAAQLQALWRQADMLSAAAARMRRDEIAQASELTRIAITSFEAGELDLVGLVDALDADLDARERLLDLELRARRASIELKHLTQGAPP